MFVSSCSDKKTDNGDSDSVSDSHEWVDLGLPSGTKWATMNVGANNSGEIYRHSSNRFDGRSVRPVLNDNNMAAESAASAFENLLDEVAEVNDFSYRESSVWENAKPTSATARLRNMEMTLAGAIDGKYKIHMNLAIDGYGNLTGIYYNDRYAETKDVNFMKLAGKQSGTNQLILEEYRSFRNLLSSPRVVLFWSVCSLFRW